LSFRHPTDLCPDVRCPSVGSAVDCAYRPGTGLHTAWGGCLALGLACVVLISGCGDSESQAVELTEDQLEEAERGAVERLKELGCKVEFAEDPWLKTSGIMVWLYPEHITDAGGIREELFVEFRYLRRLFLLVDSTPVRAKGLGQLRTLGNLLLLSARNTVTGEKGLEKIEGIVSLRLLRLNRTRITDDSLRHIERLPDLVMLYLSRTNVTDAAMERLVKLRKLTALQLSHTGITDQGVSRLSELTELTHLGLDGTEVSDDAVPHLLKLKSLEYLNLSETGITSDGLKKLIEGLPKCDIRKLESV